jgi:hypothetical protein
MVGDTLKVGV